MFCEELKGRPKTAWNDSHFNNLLRLVLQCSVCLWMPEWKCHNCTCSLGAEVAPVKIACTAWGQGAPSGNCLWTWTCKDDRVVEIGCTAWGQGWKTWHACTACGRTWACKDIACTAWGQGTEWKHARGHARMDSLRVETEMNVTCTVCT